jgi:hypothetical protein
MNSIVNSIILNYLKFLNNTTNNIIESVQKINGNISIEEIRNDFFQANWEILVESIICIPGKEYLEVYGEGADCNENSSRVSFPHKMATHYISCSQNSSNFVEDIYTGNLIDLSLYKFNSFSSIVHKANGIESSYDSIMLEHLTKDYYANIKLDDITFIKIKV